MVCQNRRAGCLHPADERFAYGVFLYVQCMILFAGTVCCVAVGWENTKLYGGGMRASRPTFGIVLYRGGLDGVLQYFCMLCCSLCVNTICMVLLAGVWGFTGDFRLFFTEICGDF